VADLSGENTARLVLLEHARADADLTNDEAQALVAFGLTAWSDHWASAALDWVDQGVCAESIEAALRLCAENKTYSQGTRHRARRLVRQQE
jgi:hypothetical protein